MDSAGVDSTLQSAFDPSVRPHERKGRLKGDIGGDKFSCVSIDRLRMVSFSDAMRHDNVYWKTTMSGTWILQNADER